MELGTVMIGTAIVEAGRERGGCEAGEESTTV